MRNGRKPDSTRDEKVATYIDQYWLDHARPPATSEIMAACGLSSTSYTRSILRRIAPGRFEISDDGTARHLVPLWVKDAIRAHQRRLASSVRRSEQVV